jgi:hypothetical protein
MSSNWRQVYGDLNTYVKNNPEIKLGQEIIEIPEHCKTEFYNRFNLVRSSFIEGHFPRMIEEARDISQRLGQAETELVARLGLEEIELPPTLRWYVKDPIDALRRTLYDSLFDLLRNRITPDSFEAAGRQAVKDLDNRLKQKAYQVWTAFSLANMVEPEALYTVDVHIADSTISHAEALNPNEQPVKRPVQATRLSLRQEDYIFTPPDMILRSLKFNKYIAIRVEPITSTWTATNATENAEWIPIEFNTPFLPGMIIVNIGDSPWDLALVADAVKARRPDQVVISEGTEGWYGSDWKPEMLLSDSILKPKSGTFIVSRQTLPAEAVDNPGLAYQKLVNDLSSGGPESNASDLKVISVGLTRKNLAPILDALLESKLNLK